MQNAAPLPACPARPNLNMPPMADATEYEARFCQALRQDRWEAAIRHPVARTLLTSPLEAVSSAQMMNEIIAMRPNALQQCMNGAFHGFDDFVPIGAQLVIPCAGLTLALIKHGLMAAAFTPGAVWVAALLGFMIHGAVKNCSHEVDDSFLNSRTENQLRQMEEQATLLEPPVIEHMLAELTANEETFSAGSLQPLYMRTVNELQTTLRRIEAADRHAARISARMNRAV